MIGVQQRQRRLGVVLRLVDQQVHDPLVRLRKTQPNQQIGLRDGVLPPGRFPRRSFSSTRREAPSEARRARGGTAPRVRPEHRLKLRAHGLKPLRDGHAAGVDQRAAGVPVLERALVVAVERALPVGKARLERGGHPRKPLAGVSSDSSRAYIALSSSARTSVSPSNSTSENAGPRRSNRHASRSSRDRTTDRTCSPPTARAARHPPRAGGRAGGRGSRPCGRARSRRSPEASARGCSPRPARAAPSRCIPKTPCRARGSRSSRIEHVAPAVHQVGRAVHRHARLAGAGPADDRHHARALAADGGVLLGLNGRHDLAHVARRRTGQHVQQHLIVDAQVGVDVELQLAALHAVLALERHRAGDHAGRAGIGRRAGLGVVVQAADRRAPVVHEQVSSSSARLYRPITIRSGAEAPTSAKSTRAKNGSSSIRRARSDVSEASWRRAVEAVDVRGQLPELAGRQRRRADAQLVPRVGQYGAGWTPCGCPPAPPTARSALPIAPARARYRRARPRVRWDSSRPVVP